MEIPQTFVATFDGIPEGPARASAIRAFLVALDGLGGRAPRWGIHPPSEATFSDEFLGVQAGVGARQGFMNIYHPSIRKIPVETWLGEGRPRVVAPVRSRIQRQLRSRRGKADMGTYVYDRA